MTQAAIEALLRPRSVTILGASDRSRWSCTAFDNLRQGGFAGTVQLVNRRGGSVHGQAAAQSVAALGEAPDLGLVLLPAEAVAEAARRHGMQIIAGAPNLVRGGSHSGNVAAADLVRAGLVDVFASDYVPPAMIEAVWRAAAETGISLPAAVATITDAPARMLKMADRGRIEAGRRADLVRVRPLGAMPVVRSTWRAGERIA